MTVTRKIVVARCPRCDRPRTYTVTNGQQGEWHRNHCQHCRIGTGATDRMTALQKWNGMARQWGK